MFHRLQSKIQRIFFAGLLVTIPTMLTFFLLRFLVNYIDQVSAPIVTRFFHTNVPGIGFLVTILLVLLVGIIGTNFLGKKLISFGDRLLSRIPFVRSIYLSAKQVIETVMFATEKPFQQVVLVPYPRKNVYAIGMVTRKASREIASSSLVPISQAEEERKGDQLLSVFIPSTPNFTSGLLIMFPRRDVIPLSMSIEEGFKYLMSGGILKPEQKEGEHSLEEWELYLY
ncbi:hypothetical protein CSA56_18305 [candidate division KSB3 bacterium]|uniref:DUF502 domain-containing protein n=1 Tax=candidate division KSB3 bacterium TaxID=2044937 RepID=A0A2G6K700_9BACT|nr:MAG: hypothetical protein CSA56_18305 [candidate division KSB3 bacterium]